MVGLVLSLFVGSSTPGTLDFVDFVSKSLRSKASQPKVPSKSYLESVSLERCKNLRYLMFGTQVMSRMFLG